LFRRRKDQNEDLNVGRGKLEIQNQDSHFSTAQISLRRKEKGRLHKMLDAPQRSVPGAVVKTSRISWVRML